MTPAHIVEIQTPKKYLLNGIWFGPKRARTIFIFIHGLTGSAFSMQGLVKELVDKDSAVLTFNNRGFGHINVIKRKRGTKSEYTDGGTAYEKFADSPDDIEGAVRTAKNLGARKIFLVGHSTGCQKSVYWAAKGGRGVKGIVALGPLSDYADTSIPGKKKLYSAGLAHAKELIRAKKPDELMPKKYTEWLHLTAQRYVSLYTPDSAEEIFTYTQRSKVPTTLRKVRIPILALLAGDDEYSDRPAQELSDWFLSHIYEGEVRIVGGVGHSFKGAERNVASLMRSWAREIKG